MILRCRCGTVEQGFVAMHNTGERTAAGHPIIVERTDAREPDCVGCDACGSTLGLTVDECKPRAPHVKGDDGRCVACHREAL